MNTLIIVLIISNCIVILCIGLLLYVMNKLLDLIKASKVLNIAADRLEDIHLTSAQLLSKTNSIYFLLSNTQQTITITKQKEN